MKEKIKLICVYCPILWKRMWKTHKILLTFLLLPLFLLGITQLEREDETKIQMAVYIEGVQENIPEAERKKEKSEFDGKMNEGENAKNLKFLEELKERLREREGVLVFSFCDSEEALKREVASARAECGYCIPADLLVCIESGKYSKIIKSYESPQSSLQTICEESLFAEIFSLYEEETFGKQAAELIYEELEKSGRINFDEVQEQNKLAARAEELLEKYQYNGSTFQFSYEVYSEEMAKVNGVEKENSGFISVRGILALAIYICGLCGTLDALEDENKVRTVRLKGRRIFQLLTIYLPILMMSVVTLICLILTGELNSMGEELLRLCCYQIIMMLYCLVLKKLCGKEERLAAAMPVLIICSVIVCPVFVDLSQFIPFFNVLKKAFPISYYLV